MNRDLDWDAFAKLLDQLCAVFDRPPAKNELRVAYWDALRFVSLAEVERNVKRIIANATRRSKWPKPGDLRDEAPAEVAQRSSGSEAERRAAAHLNDSTWREFQARDPQLCEIELGIARCARILASNHESTPQYTEARQLDWQLRQRRIALLTERASVK